MGNIVLQGSLASFKLPDVLTFLNTTRQTGTLTVVRDDKESYVFFDDGSLIYAGSNQDQFRLAAILLRKKRITKQQADHIDELMRREGGRFGQLAVQQGLLTESQLRDYLKVQASEIIYDCFVWSDGTFAFSEKLDLPQHAVTISVDLSNPASSTARRPKTRSASRSMSGRFSSSSTDSARSKSSATMPKTNRSRSTKWCTACRQTN
jgi:hypothetical protein